MDDFLIIGGGIAGVSAGARLSNHGQVTVLEAETGLGYHASGRSAAMFEETYGSPSTLVLNRASRQYLSDENGGVLSPRGLMLIGTAQDGDAFGQDMKTMALAPMTLDEAIQIVPILDPGVVKQVGYHAEAWDIDTDLLIQNFAREIRANSGIILTDQRVSSIERTSGGWRVVTANDREFNVKILLNAAGAWVDEIAGMAGIAPIGFVPYRRSMARIPAPGGLNITDWPLLFGADESWYAKPDAGKLLISPADADPTTPHDAWAEDLTLAEGIARFEAVTTTTVTRLESNWAGLRTFSPDRSLVLGPDITDSTFVWVAGQGGYGFQSSPGASQLVCDLITGERSSFDKDVIASLSPKRFS